VPWPRSLPRCRGGRPAGVRETRWRHPVGAAPSHPASDPTAQRAEAELVEQEVPAEGEAPAMADTDQGLGRRAADEERAELERLRGTVARLRGQLEQARDSLRMTRRRTGPKPSTPAARRSRAVVAAPVTAALPSRSCSTRIGRALWRAQRVPTRTTGLRCSARDRTVALGPATTRLATRDALSGRPKRRPRSGPVSLRARV
jgi:hypothetical protein